MFRLIIFLPCAKNLINIASLQTVNMFTSLPIKTKMIMTYAYVQYTPKQAHAYTRLNTYIKLHKHTHAHKLYGQHTHTSTNTID